MRETVAPPAIAPPRVAVRPRASAAPSATSPRATYETFYGFNDKPFAADSDLRFLYHSSAHDRVLHDLSSSVENGDAIAVLTAPDGMGKTMLCRALVDQLDRRTLVSFVAHPPASAENLLSTLLVDFGVVSGDEADAGRLTSASRVDLSGALRDFLRSLAGLEATALVILDDAHRLPDAVLHELRSLADVGASGKLLQIVLVGDDSLTRQLTSSEFRAIDDRVAARLELGPLDGDEVPGYVAHRLALAGRGERVGFSEVGLRKVYALSRGVPGVINQICDGALTLGYQSSASNIDGDLVDAAAQQLGLLPTAAGASWRERVIIIVLMLALMLAGAAGAGWVFREPLGRVLAQFSHAR
jgi:general secretion pathway protein A